MHVNVKGRVRNISLPRRQGLLPLFEAVINSVDAIEDAKRAAGQDSINVRILRHNTMPLGSGHDDEERHLRPMYGFEVTDNGIGFTDDNYEAFNEADTQFKASRGGKGVGRFLWLKAFDRVEIDSTFRRDGILMRRKFDFSLAAATGITNHREEQAGGNCTEGTIVRLIGFKSEYESNVPKRVNAIAQRMVEHCLEYFIVGNMPQVVLSDDDDTVHLDGVYQRLVANNEAQTLNIGGIRFDVIHFLLYAHADLKHHVSYCGDKRVVKDMDRLSSRIPNLPSFLIHPDTGDRVIYAGYVSSDYLDSHVNQQRTDFDSIFEDGLQIPGEPRWIDIEDVVLAASKQFLFSHTEHARTEKEKRVREYVTNHAPEYRYVLKHHSNRLDVIPPDASDDVLDDKLHEIGRGIEADLRREAIQLMEEGALSNDHVVGAHLERFSRWWEEYNDQGKANLAKYIVSRKLMLDMLDRSLKLQNNGKYSREEILHKIIFPLKQTSDDITSDQHNLWIIDEKLAYHAYLASDVPLRSVPSLDTDASSRPDLLVFFDRPIVVVDDEYPYGSGVVIFEFKRPMREDYDDDDNPFDQVLRYVRDIRSGNVRTKDGRPFHVQDRTPFFCYIVCDLTRGLKWQTVSHDLTTTPDGGGYYGYNKQMGAYIEVIGFDKLVSDAHKRNRILFDKLNLPDSLASDRGGDRRGRR